MCFITIASVYGLTMGVYEIIHPVGCKDSGLNHFMFWQIVDMNFYNLFCTFFYDLLGFRGEPSCLLFLKNFFFLKHNSIQITLYKFIQLLPLKILTKTTAKHSLSAICHQTDSPTLKAYHWLNRCCFA